MADEFRITYGVDDGYAGGDRPQHTSISANDFEADCSEQSLKDLFWEEIERHMRENLHAFCNQESAFIAWAKEQQKKQLAEDAD